MCLSLWCPWSFDFPQGCVRRKRLYLRTDVTRFAWVFGVALQKKTCYGLSVSKIIFLKIYVIDMIIIVHKNIDNYGQW